MLAVGKASYHLSSVKFKLERIMVQLLRCHCQHMRGRYAVCATLYSLCGLSAHVPVLPVYRFIEERVLIVDGEELVVGGLGRGTSTSGL